MTKEHNNASQTDWRELCRRLYVELWHCDKQMTSGARPKWKQGPAVRDVLRDANLALEATPAAATAPASTQDEPFGYFRAEPFGWTDCAATDEGAIALYERPAAPAVPQGEPVYQLARATGPVADAWIDVAKDVYDDAGFHPSDFKRRILYATPAAPSQPVTLTEAERVKCLVASDCIGTVKMTYDSGPYEITRTSINASRLIDAIIAALREKE